MDRPIDSIDTGGYDEADAPLLAVLRDSKAAGFLGRAPVTEHVHHARSLERAIPQSAATFMDLGSGGGIPGLVVAWDRTDLEGILLDGSTKRGAFLQHAVEALELDDRIEVVIDRAENVGRSSHRGKLTVVLARSFGPPSAVAECASPLLAQGGLLIVSDPPESMGGNEERWPAAGLVEFGLRVVEQVAGPPAYTVLEQMGRCPERYPRRVGVPVKRPVF